MLSLIIPIYQNEENLDRLLPELVRLDERLEHAFEVVLVVDGSPDRCYQILQRRLPELPLKSQLILLSRNFGSFAAIAAGMSRSRGETMACLAADLQEPPELILEFERMLKSGRQTSSSVKG